MTVSEHRPAGLDQGEPPLSAPLRLSFDYTRSVGPVLGRFFTALRERRIVGVRGTDGRVYVPPAEYDPVSYRPLTEIVEVASVGTVVSWSWQPDPLPGQPLDRPFAWALIKLDGADVPILHAVDVPTPDAISTGVRVHAHWADEPVGPITDIAYFALGDAPELVETTTEQRDPVSIVITPIELEIEHSTSYPESTYLRALKEGRLLGARTVSAGGEKGKVYFPAREADPATGRQLTEFVEVADTGTITTFAIINIPFLGQRIKPPYVAAYVLLDGADIPFLTLVSDVDAHDVRMGMRVQALWKPREEWGYDMGNIEYFRPTGEPDADYDTYKHHL
ncbi:MAG TPA: OB-fold domain-containing protein [Mycobacterium sp.]|nr:OB-fold domain-containing protein [Mycobacterium sp.]